MVDTTSYLGALYHLHLYFEAVEKCVGAIAGSKLPTDISHCLRHPLDIESCTCENWPTLPKLLNQGVKVDSLELAVLHPSALTNFHWFSTRQSASARSKVMQSPDRVTQIDEVRSLELIVLYRVSPP